MPKYLKSDSLSKQAAALAASLMAELHSSLVFTALLSLRFTMDLFPKLSKQASTGMLLLEEPT